MASTPLERAINAGMKPGGQMMGELMKLENYPIWSAQDAKAICAALQSLALHGDSERPAISRIYALTTLFQDVSGRDVPAYRILAEEGVRWLLRIFRTKLPLRNDEDVSDLLFILKVISAFGSQEAAEAVVQAARFPLNPINGGYWPLILSFYSSHPHRDYVFEALRDPLPPLCVGFGLLESANQAARNGDLERHPFDSAKGCERLREWLLRPLPNCPNCATSAVAALAYLHHPRRDEVLGLALEHADAKVQIEAARVAGQLGRPRGLKLLAKFATDVAHATVAQQHLHCLGRGDLIPTKVTDPAFEAKAMLSQFLAQPDKLGAAPEELDVIDQRTLAWPPSREPVDVWLIRFLLRDRTGLDDDAIGCGIVGWPATSCFMNYKMHERAPEDAYAIHCYAAMQNLYNIVELDEFDDEEEYAGLLRHWTGALLERPVITLVAELSLELALPNRVVALVSATLQGEQGWVVLDGQQTTWYPQAEQPRDVPSEAVLKLHVGRRLLGFGDQPDRRRFLLPPIQSRDPASIVTTYEKLLGELEASDASLRYKLLYTDGLLTRHAKAYVDAFAFVRAMEPPRATLAIFGLYFEIAGRSEIAVKEAVLDCLGPMGVLFDAQVDALISLGRTGEVAPLIHQLVPFWNHGRGRQMFANAARRAREPELADAMLEALYEGDKQYSIGSCHDMSVVAEIWFRRGEAQQARELLIRCMQEMLADIRDRRYRTWRKLYVEAYCHHRAAYLGLFPAEEGELVALDLLPTPK